MTEAERKMHANAGRMADFAIILLGGRNLFGYLPPVSPDEFSRYAILLRKAAEAYNDAVLEYQRENKE